MTEAARIELHRAASAIMTALASRDDDMTSPVIQEGVAAALDILVKVAIDINRIADAAEAIASYADTLHGAGR